MAALYIHIPFCRHKCIYCDFYSTTQTNHINAYVTALLNEMELWADDPFYRQQQFSTLYFGGGTPSLLSPHQIETMLKKLFSTFQFIEDVEISLEANPGAVLELNLSGYRHAGVNRLTLGIQSFQNEELFFLTRIHSAEDAEAAFTAARHAGFDNIGIDLIFGLPGQTLESWEENCRKALAWAPEHISMYGLTYEENTPLWRQLQAGALQQCDDELERDMFLLGMTMLKGAGYEQYEISNFAMPGFSSRHNQQYWDGSPFLSLGPSAHSFDGEKRWWNVDDLHRYMDMLHQNKKPIAGSEKLTLDEQRDEFILLGLRRQSGIDLMAWQKLTHSPIADVLEKIAGTFSSLDSIAGFESSTQGCLLTLYQNHLCLTQQGVLLYNSVCDKLSLL